MSSVFFLVLAICFNAYFVALQTASPGTFFGTMFSFSAVWFYLSVVFAVMFILRKKHLRNAVSGKAKAAVVSVVSAGVIIAAINLFFIANPRLADGSENPEYVIILGGGITKDAELTDSVRQRVEFAAGYLKLHPHAVAVVTGGKGPFSPCPESDVLKPALAACGISQDRILVENRAKDTIQNLQYSAGLLADYQGVPVKQILDAPITIITSDFHIARALRLAGRMGFTDIRGAASRTPALFIPNSYAREICSYIKLNLRILFTGRPGRISG